MSCKFINPHTNNELEASKQLMEYYKLNEYEELDSEMSNFFDSKVNYFFSDSFKESFGDWTQTQYPEDDRIDFEGGPKLFQDGNNLYVIDKNNEKMFINNVRFEGLEAFDMFKGNIVEIKNDAKVMIAKYIFDKHKNSNDDITDFSNLNFTLRNEINNFFDDQIIKRPDNEDVYELLREFNDDFELEVKDFLNSVNLSYTENQDDDDSVSQELQQDNGAIVGKGSVERNSKDNATSNVKLMLSLIPDTDNTSKWFAGDSMISFDKIWNEVQSNLSDIPKLLTSDGQPVNPLTIISDRLNKMASSKPYIKNLIDSLESSNDNLKVQFFQAFGNLGKTNQDTMEVDLKDFSFKTTNAAESSTKKSKILTQTGLDFKNKFTTYNVDNNTYSFDLVTYSEFRKLYFQLYAPNGLYSKVKGINFKINKLVVEDKSPSQELLVQRQELMNEANDIFHNIVSELGFNLSPLSHEYLLSNNGQYDTSSFDSAIIKMGEFYTGFDYFDKAIIPNPTATPELQNKHAISVLFDKGKYLNPFKGEGKSVTGQKILSDIADAIANFDTDMSESMVMSGEKSIWAFSQTTHLFDTINILNNSPEEVEKRLNQPFNRHSVYLKQLNNGSKIKLHRTNSMMEKDNASGSVDNTNTSKNDAIVRDVFEAMLGKKNNGKSLFPTPVPADKGTAFKTELGYFLDTNIRIENGKIVVNEDTLNIFKGYINDELSTAIAAKKFINKQIDNEGNVDTSNLIQYKHVDGNINTFDILDASGNSIFTKSFEQKINRNNINDINAFIENNQNEGYRMIYAGNVFKNFMFSSLSPESLIDKPEIFSLFYEKDFTPINIDIKAGVNKDTLTNSQINYLNTYLTDILSDTILDHQQQLIDADILNMDTGRSKFDKEIYGLYYNPDLGVSGTVSQIAADYTINSIIAQIEFSKLFNGSINNHKNIVDYFKRSAKGYIDGKGLLLGKENNDHVSHIAVLQDMEVSSPYLEEMGDIGKKFYGNNRINQADAQAYITPERWKFLLERLGQFGTVEKAIWNKIEQMEAGVNVEFTSKELKTLSTKPLKGVYYNNNVNNPLYLKYSQVVLLKSFVKGSPLEKLLNQMRTQSIDEAIMASGVKVGAQFANENVSESILTNSDTFTLKSIPIDNRFWKLQQDLPNKGIKETLLGSQIQKNIFDNFKFGPEQSYTFNDKTYSGDDVYNNIHSIIGEKSNRGLEKFKKKFDIQADYTINNWGDFAKDIAQQLRDEKIDDNVIQAVEKELTPYVIPQARDKVLSTIMSKINKATVKLKTNGSSLIQMSNFGLDQNLAEETGVVWIKNKQQLAEPRKGLNADGNPMVLPGQVFISGNLLGQYIPNWKDYSVDELFGEDRQGGMFPKEILQLVGYRIPNQAMSSNDALEVVGMLPDTYIDTIVAYTGITTKTGSDFDVDKMFMFMPSMKQSESGVEYENYDIEKSITEQSDGALNNRLFEMYYSILTHPDNYDNLITPIDHEHLKNFITKDLFPISNRTNDLKAFSPLYQIDMKYEFIAGGFGIGQVANQLVDSMMNQNVQESLDYYIGWGNYKMVGKEKKTVFDMKSDKGFYDESGTYKISDTLTALLNGFVDIAKDPYITRGNWNTQTTNTGAFLIRTGVHPFKVAAFLSQPSLMELVNKISEKEGITSKDKSSGLVLPELKQEYLGKLQESLGFNNSDFEQLLADINSKKSVNLINGILSNNKITNRSVDDLKSNIKVQPGEETPQYYLDQYLALAEYDNLKSTVKEFTKSVGASKYGETGIGKRLTDFIIQRNKTIDVVDKDIIQGFLKKFYNAEQITDGFTSLGSHQKNSETFFTNLVQANPKIFLSANNYFTNIMNEMTSEIHKNKRYLDDNDIGKVFEQAIYTMITSESEILKGKDSEFNFLFNKETEDFLSLTGQMARMREQYRKENKPNFFLENIETKEDGDYSFLGVDSIKRKPNGFKLKMTDAWRELDKDNPDLSDNLVKLAYNQSGFRYNGNQMYQFIPHEVFVKNRINNYIDRVANDIIDGRINPDTVKDNIYRHNWNNSQIVPTISKKDIGKNYPNNSGFRLKYDSNRHSGKGTIGSLEMLTYPKFVSKDEFLYKLDSYKPILIYGKTYFEPTYFMTHKLGYNSKQGQFHEYNMYNEKKQSNVTLNNINEDRVRIISAIKSNLALLNPTPYNDVFIDNKFNVMIDNLEQPSNIDVFETTEIKVNINENLLAINIYAGTNENAELSNFAIRPFEYEDRTYQSVEQAFQLQKYFKFSNTIKNAELGNQIWKTTNGDTLRKLGKSIEDFNTTSWGRMSSFIMKELLTESFQQNPKALTKLLATGNAELTHIQDKGKWGKEFPRILMEVRKDLKDFNKVIETEIEDIIVKIENEESIITQQQTDLFNENDETDPFNCKLK